jgi:hypothetical protein
LPDGQLPYTPAQADGRLKIEECSSLSDGSGKIGSLVTFETGKNGHHQLRDFKIEYYVTDSAPIYNIDGKSWE